MTLQLHTLDNGRLVIGRYPPFSYDARGGGGVARVSAPGRDGLQALEFEAGLLRIPPLQGKRGRFLGLPLPPGVAVTITAEELRGQLDPRSGALGLRFRARFQLRLGPWYRAPDLHVDTQLVTGAVRGQRHRAEGSPLNGDGEAVLVGVATVAPSGSVWLDRFLGLPDEALAVLQCRLSPS